MEVKRPYKTRLDALMAAYARMTFEERATAKLVMDGYDRCARERGETAEAPTANEQAMLTELGADMAEAEGK